MAPRKNKSQEKKVSSNSNAYIANAGIVEDQKIVETLETNYMPYAMSVIVSRAIPEIDGFKPSHRKLLYTMYKMGLLQGARTKSANVVGRTMKLNPHGDAAIYETMVRLARGNESLLHPYVDSKGNFGKSYSRDMAYAASRYTEVKLEKISGELFRDIDKDTVDFVDNYDNTTKEPTLLPVTYPSVLVNANTGIAVGMASSICSFNLREVCETTAQLLKNSEHNIMTTLKAPDFPGGGVIIYDQKQMSSIYKTGRGSFKVRARYNFDKENGCIEIYQIPPTTTIEAIIDKIIDFVKQGKIKEISDIRDETDLSGLKIAIDIKRGQDPEKLMQKLFKLTTLEDSFSANFNILIGNTPKTLGVRQILNEWIAFRKECVKRRVYFDLNKKKDKLHLLLGLSKILLDIDKAIKIVRETPKEEEVVPNLMIGFGIDQIQADFVAEIKLRNLNKEYILKKTSEVDTLKSEIVDLEDILKNEERISNIIISELKTVAEKFGQSRKSILTYKDDVEEEEEAEEIEDYEVNHFFSIEGYYKKITPASLRMSGAHKLKEGDEIIQHIEGKNTDHLLFFSDRSMVYKGRAFEFEDTKTSVLGDFIPVKMEMEEGEIAKYMAVTDDYSGYMMFFFENGKVSKVPMKAYETKQNRRKLVKAYSDKSPLVAAFYIKEESEFLIENSAGKALILKSELILPKTTKDNQGVAVMTIKGKNKVIKVQEMTENLLTKPKNFVPKAIPNAGKAISDEDFGDQMKLFE